MLTLVLAYAIFATIGWIRSSHDRKELRHSLDLAAEAIAEHESFRKAYKAYRAKHDPIDLTREGNVITIGKSSSSNSRD